MQDEKLITMREAKKFEVIQQIIKKEIKQKEASKILNISERQIRNLKKKVEKEGIEGVIHKNKGRPSNNKTVSEEDKKRIIELYKSKYEGFRPTFYCEQLAENENINYSRETIRKILTEENLHKVKKRKERHREQRERRACRGELIQVDGSYHDWFSTGEKSWLLNFIDDATGEVFLRYADSESTRELLKAMKEYINEKGVPQALYVDRDSIYTTTREQTVEEQLTNTYPMTQFTRAMKEIGTEVICAYSPQAKGRVVRSFQTHQDRLVKENKLRGITNKEEGKKYLQDYVRKHNKKFSVKAKSEIDMHTKKPRKNEIDRILSIQEKRKIAKDFTIKYKNKTYQILKEQKVMVLTRNPVTIEERLDNSIHIKYKDCYLKFKDITETIREKVKQNQNQKTKQEEVKETQTNTIKVMNRKEISNVKYLHPWRKSNSLFFRKRKF